jgi:hypothetical protein
MVRFRSASSQVPVDAADRNKTWAELALYNRKADVSESTDVSAQNPATVQRLTEYAEAYRSEFGGQATMKSVVWPEASGNFLFFFLHRFAGHFLGFRFLG